MVQASRKQASRNFATSERSWNAEPKPGGNYHVYTKSEKKKFPSKAPCLFVGFIVYKKSNSFVFSGTLIFGKIPM